MIEKIKKEMLRILGNDAPGITKELFANSKFLRADLCITVGKKKNIDDEFLLKRAAIVELLHLASLIHDDVIDCAEKRRGKTSENIKHGNQNAVLTGDYIILTTFSEIEMMFDSTIKKFIFQTLKIMTLKEIEHNFRKNDYTMSLKKYLSIAEGKTGSLFGLAAWLGSYSTNCPEQHRSNFYKLGKKLGVLYQCTDDIFDLWQDIPNEIITFPLILILEKFPDLRQGKRRINKNYELMEQLKKQESIKLAIDKIVKMLAEVEEECLSLSLPKSKIFDCIKKKINSVRSKHCF